MKLLFIVYSVIDETNGISKKIQAQVEGLRKTGIDVSLCHYLEIEGIRYWAVNGKPIALIGSGITAHLRYYYYFSPIFEYIKENAVDIVYLRYVHNATPFMLYFFKNLKKWNIKLFIEIPTYPYDGEYPHPNLLKKIQLRIEKLSRGTFNKYVKKVITYSDDKEIFDIETIRLSNSIALNRIPLKERKINEGNIRFIGVANLSFWHGFDRFLYGLHNYYLTTNERNIFFDIVGNGDLMVELKNLSKNLRLEDVVIFHGSLSGKQLDDVFERADIGVGCLGCHRKGIKEVKSLKNVEYAARGIPFIYSENNSDFDSMKYVIKIIPDESPINISEILTAFYHIDKDPEHIRETITHLSWDEQMKKVHKFLIE